MKKVIMAVSNKDKEDFLNSLRREGVIHIKHLTTPSSSELILNEERVQRLEKAVSILSSISCTKPLHAGAKRAQELDAGVGRAKDLNARTRYTQGLDSQFGTGGRGRTARQLDELGIVHVIQEIFTLEQQREDLEKNIQDEKNILGWYKQWGGFSLSDLLNLKRRGLYLKLYVLNKGEFKKIRKKENIFAIKTENGYFYIAGIFYKEEEGLPFNEVKIPEQSFDSTRIKFEEDNKKHKEVLKQLGEHIVFQKSLEDFMHNLEGKRKFLEVFFGMQKEEGFSLIQGYCPAPEISKIISLADRNGAGYLIEDPNAEEEPPTLIRNPKWLRVINPVFQFINTLPGYREFDISFAFLLFFSLFFAIIIGDAGYGIIICLGTLFARRKLRNIPKEPFLLMYILGFSTVIWGTISGTWFGFEQITHLPIFNALIIDKLNSFAGGNQDFMIFMCFTIGVVHLTFAHFMRFIRAINTIQSLSQIGWVCILWGLYFLAGRLVLNKAFPNFAGYLIIVGVSLVLLFANFQKNILKGILLALIDTPLAIAGSFGDIVSYLRLFAVGSASLAVATTFNSFAVKLGFNNILTGLLSALVLIFAHTLNITLSFLSVIVHGIRLNMLEFSGHLGMQWSGNKYMPFSEE